MRLPALAFVLALFLTSCDEVVTPTDITVGPSLSIVEGDVLLTTQSQIDAFDATEVSGDLTISGSEVTSLAGLSGLTRVGGHLRVQQTAVSALTGLDALTDVGEDLLILGNLQLASLAGLERLERVLGAFGVFSSPNLLSVAGLSSLLEVGAFQLGRTSVSSLNGLERLQTISGLLSLSLNALESVEGLDGLTGLGSVNISNEPQLTDLSALAGVSGPIEAISLIGTGVTSLAGLEGTTTLTGLSLDSNPELVDLSAVSGVTGLETIAIRRSPRLEDLQGLPASTSLSSLVVQGIDSLRSLAGMEDLSSVEILALTDLPNLESLDGLRSLSDVSLSLSVRNVDGLTDLSGLGALRRVERLVLQQNDNMESLAGLEGLATLAQLHLRRNPLLHDLSGIGQLGALQQLLVEGNRSLRTLGPLPSLRELGSLSIRNSMISELSGLTALDSLGFFSVIGDSALVDLSALSTVRVGGIALNTTSIEALPPLPRAETMSTVSIFQNARLTDLSGLASTDSIGFLSIRGNGSLSSLTGLEELRVTRDLRIILNAVLTDCSALLWLLVEGQVDFSRIGDNAPGCNSADEILANAVHEGDLILTTQSEVDAFRYFKVAGGLGVSGPDITNLDGLSPLRIAEGGVFLTGNTSLTDIAGLAGLDTLGGSLQIRGNGALTSLDGLSGITSVPGLLRIEGNTQLQEFDALSGVTDAVQVRIVSNPNLTSLAGLSSLTSVNSAFQLMGTRFVSDLGALGALTTVGGDFIVSGHNGLQSLAGLSNLTSVGGRLIMTGNDQLVNTDGLGGLQSIGSDVLIEVNPSLPDLDGFSAVTAIGGDLTVRSNPSLQDCSGLAPVLEAGGVVGSVTIENNATGCNTLTDVIGNTTTGPDIEIVPVDETTGEPAPVSMTFDNVTGSGETTITSFETGITGPPPPSNFRLGTPPIAYDIETTATFDGAVEVCIDYAGVSYGQEESLKLLHYENGTWSDVTTSLDTSANVICGSVTSFSPFLVAEANLAPELNALSLPVAPVALGDEVVISAEFEDANPGDVHTATIEWGDGTVTSGTVTESGGVGSISGGHLYSEPGVYTITVRVEEAVEPGADLSDTLSSASNSTTTYVVVFDASGGFVTGGGWIESPAGACAFESCTSDTTGRASFGFVSRYERGASVPTGNTEFRFKAGGLHFSSDVYDWLVPAGGRAQFRGHGQINGVGSYGFLVTAIDAAHHPEWEGDRFRIKIWEVSTGAVVYDNQIGEVENTDASTELVGGSIVIHE